ncbi:hypothetical protein RP20_CCG028118 [Aedes albopictus]|nr:hypothetical protein RP20_CCG028118 [Aedes albopictus]
MEIKCIGILIFILALLSKASDITITSSRLDPKTDPNFYKPGTLRITKKSRNLMVVAGSFELLQNAGEDVQAVFTLLRKNILTDQYWEVWAQNKPLCAFLNEDTFVLPALREVSNLPEAGTCPIPKGRYNIDNYKHALSNEIPLPPGDYLLVAQTTREGRLIVGMEWSATVQ